MNNLFLPEDEVAANRASTGNRIAQPEGGSHAAAAPSVYITVLQEIGRRCESKVTIRNYSWQICLSFLFLYETKFSLDVCVPSQLHLPCAFLM